MGRGRSTIHALTLAAGALALAVSCWADFPDSRFHSGGTPPDGGAPDFGVGRLDRGTLPPLDGTVRRDAAAVPDLGADSQICQPGAFVRCAANDTLVYCNAGGTGTEQIACAPGRCNNGKKLCTQCSPTSSPTCQGDLRVSCSVYGVRETTQCAGGCDTGKCCTDVDQDGWSTCDGDCNDGDEKVNPDQQQYQSTPSAGSFDYDCSGAVELERPAPADCQPQGAGCTGDGWVGGVPDCGVSGSFATCTRQGGACVEQTTPTLQACR